MQIIHHDLQDKFGIAKPKIYVTGLNPHAGENGYLGQEEIDVINPVILHARSLGMDVHGAFPADTLFQQKYLKDADCVSGDVSRSRFVGIEACEFWFGCEYHLGLATDPDISRSRYRA